MNWFRNYFTPLTLLCSARHAGATPYGAAPSSGALHLCPPWQPMGPHPAVQRLRARRRTCNVQRLAARRYTCNVQRLAARRNGLPRWTEVQRPGARRCTCNVQRLAARRCTVTYPATWLGPPPPPHTLSLSPRALPPLPLSPLSNLLPNLANLKNLSVDFEVKPSLKVIISDPLFLIEVKFSHCSFVGSLGKP